MASTVAWALALALALCLALSRADADDSFPDLVTINVQGLTPENFKWSDTLSGFVVGSLGKGQLRLVDTSGNVTVLTDLPELSQVSGVLVDDDSGVVLACMTLFPPNGSAPHQAGLGLVNLTDRSLIHYYDLTGVASGSAVGRPNFANDVALDSNGNAFVTDSLGGQVWKVPPPGQGAPSSYVSSAALQGHVEVTGNTLGVGPDGIVWLPGMLLIGVYGNATYGGLYRVAHPIPNGVQQVTIVGSVAPPLVYADGMVLSPDGTSLFVACGQGFVVQLQTTDNWNSAVVVATHALAHATPSSPTYAGDFSEMYVLCVSGFGAGPYYIERVTSAVILADAPPMLDVTTGPPESFAFVPSLGFVVGSFSHGNLYAITDYGNSTAFTSTITRNTTGVHADLARGRILVCNSVFPPNGGAQHQTALLYVDAVNGTVTNTVDLTPLGNTHVAHWAGDITIDSDGNAFVTDMLAAQIYKVTSAGTASVYTTLSLLAGHNDTQYNSMGLGADGIAWTPGYLLIGIYGNETNTALVRVAHPVPDTPVKVHIYNGVLPPALDGIVFSADYQSLYAVSNAGTVVQLQTQDNWASAMIVATAQVRCTTPTALAWRGSDLFASCCDGFGGPDFALELVTPAFTMVNEPSSVAVNEFFFQPTSITYTAATGFLLNSQNQGTVSRLNDAGDVSDYSNFAPLKHSSALLASEEMDMFFVAATRFPPGAATPAIYIGNLTTGEQLDDGGRVQLHGLAADTHYISGLALDSQQRLYATESVGGSIVRVVYNSSEVYMQSGDFVGAEDATYNPNGFGITGIACVGQGDEEALVVVRRGNAQTAALFRVTIEDDAVHATYASIYTGHLLGAQALLLDADGERLYVGGTDALYTVLSFDNFQSVATVTSAIHSSPVVSMTLRMPYICLLNSDLGSAGPYSVSLVRSDQNLGHSDFAEITVPLPAAFVPENFDFSHSTGAGMGSLLVGSLADGQVRVVDGDGSVSLLTALSSVTQSSGVRSVGNTLYVVGATFPPVPNAQHQASLTTFDMSQGQLLQSVDLTAIGPAGVARLANDVAVSPAGVAYVTDSLGSQLWQVSATGVASQYVSHPLLKGVADPVVNTLGIGVNGIEYVVDALQSNLPPFLLATRSGNATTSALLKISLSQPVSVVQVPILNGNIAGADGMCYVPTSGASQTLRGWLYVAGSSRVYQLFSDNNWQSAVVVAIAEDVCVGITAVKAGADGTVFALCANNFGSGPYQIVALAGKMQAVSAPLSSSSLDLQWQPAQTQPVSVDYSARFGTMATRTTQLLALDDFGGANVLYAGTSGAIRAARFRGSESAELVMAYNSYVQLVSLQNGAAQVADLVPFTAQPGAPAPTMVVDMALDEAGNAYIIDAASTALWRYTAPGDLHTLVDLGVSGNCLLPGSLTTTFGPIGVVHVPGAVLVAVCGTNSAMAALLRVELPSDPTVAPKVSPVNMRNADGSTAPGFTFNVRGLAVTADFHFLYAVTASGAVQQFVSQDDWRTVTLVASGTAPTCASSSINVPVVARGDNLWQYCPAQGSLVLACSNLVATPAASTVSFAQPNFLPEGLTYVPQLGFLVGSLGNSPGMGHVHLLEGDGSLYDLLPMATAPFQTVGLLFQPPNLVLAAQTTWPPNPAAPQQSGVAVIHLPDATVSGPLFPPYTVNFVDLTSIGPAGKPRLANDVAMDNKGNLYVTESFGGQIIVAEVNGTGKYNARQYSADVLLSGRVDSINSLGLGANGILYHSDGFLLVSRSGNDQNAALLKVQMTNPPKVTKIPVTGSGLAGADGLRFGNTTKTAYMVGRQTVYRILDTSTHSEPKWSSAHVDAIAPVSCLQPSSVVMAGSDIWVVCTAAFTSGPYALEKVTDRFVLTHSSSPGKGSRSSGGSDGIPLAAFVAVMFIGAIGACVGLFYHHRYASRGQETTFEGRSSKQPSGRSTGDQMMVPMLSDYDA